MSRLRLLTVVALAFSMLAVMAAPALGQGPLVRPQTWVDGELFNGVVTPATFDPANGNFDELYMGCPFKDGVPLISDAGPGDADYNGGRWHVNVFNGDPAMGDCDKYANVDGDNDANFDPADFDSTDVYFECPLLPLRGGRA